MKKTKENMNDRKGMQIKKEAKWMVEKECKNKSREQKEMVVKENNISERICSEVMKKKKEENELQRKNNKGRRYRSKQN